MSRNAMAQCIEDVNAADEEREHQQEGRDRPQNKRRRNIHRPMSPTWTVGDGSFMSTRMPGASRE